MKTKNLTFEKPHRPLKIKLLNWTGKVLDNLGMPLGKFNEESLLKRAIEITNLSDFGDQKFRKSLQVLVKSLHEEANLNWIGNQTMQYILVQRLVSRLRLQEDFKRYPEIAKVTIRKPLFIVGLPRTGTTFLHNLMAQDPASRWLRLWEQFNPSPPPNIETFERDSRPQEAEKFINKQLSLAPQLATAHNLNAHNPEECNILFEHDIVSGLFDIKTNVKSYSDWLFNQDLTDSYQFYRKQLQLLSWRWPGDHWLLKAPFHLWYLDNLLTVFDDACIIQNHRDPQKTLPSTSSLAATVRSIFSDVVDLNDIGEHFLQGFSKGIERAMKVRESANPRQFYDVYYSNLIKDPIGTVRQIYDYFGYEFTDTFQHNLETWISNNPQHKYGVHRYSLEQFGLKSEEVREKFTNYYQRFAIKIENS